MAVLDTRPTRWFTGVAVAFLALLPPFLSSYLLTLFTQVLIFALMAMSVDLLLGFTGLPSLGQAAYFGLSAYTVAVLSTRYAANFWRAAALGFILSVLLAALFGLLALRATGTYFLMITLALGQVVWGLAYRWVSMTGGDNGLAGVPSPDLGFLSVGTPLRFFYFTFVVFLVGALALYLIIESPFGHSLMGIREEEARMRTLGYYTWLHKYLAFLIAGGVSGVSGVLWAYYNGFVSPQDLSLTTNIESLLMVVLGGSGTLLGPAVGSLVIVFLKNFVSAYTKRWLLILGSIYIATIMYAPRGLLGTLREWGRQRKREVRRVARPLAGDGAGQGAALASVNADPVEVAGGPGRRPGSGGTR